MAFTTPLDMKTNVEQLAEANKLLRRNLDSAQNHIQRLNSELENARDEVLSAKQHAVATVLDTLSEIIEAELQKKRLER